jgi:aromatic ring-opening dioxygenase catalytic subunit (LigB family)
MGTIVANVALSHAPGLTGWLDKAPLDQQARLRDGFAALGRAVRAARPDVIIGIANDHVLNLPFDNTPDFCVGVADRWAGPAEWFRDWVNVPDYEVAGNREVARILVRQADKAGIRFAFAEELLFDDNWSVPLFYITPDYDIPLVPIHMNCIVPPLPSPAHCYEVGSTIANIVRDHLPADMRVALMATGGLSHDPGGPKYFQVDEEFDRWFLALLEQGGKDNVLRQATIERMIAGGDGGTTELLAWLATLGAADGAPARTICYEPAVALRCGMGCVAWDCS